MSSTTGLGADRYLAPAELPGATVTTAHQLTTFDGASVTGLLRVRPGATTVMLLMHPRQGHVSSRARARAAQPGTKETVSFIAWIVYAAYLHARATAGWRNTSAAWINIAGFVAMLSTCSSSTWLSRDSTPTRDCEPRGSMTRAPAVDTGRRPVRARTKNRVRRQVGGCRVPWNGQREHLVLGAVGLLHLDDLNSSMITPMVGLDSAPVPNVGHGRIRGTRMRPSSE